MFLWKWMSGLTECLCGHRPAIQLPLERGPRDCFNRPVPALAIPRPRNRRVKGRTPGIRFSNELARC